ncbi:toxin [Chitinophaga alhagiae]|uniref:Toxin n=1 Tax=Chitinophaga alhagiae TaxID=2203219 RepID=A0ABM6WC05_9BACT|nr:toxin [Chitinophaga alhagiae]AWO01462.1 toxin [Chitinophaga alhagiae]
MEKLYIENYLKALHHKIKVGGIIKYVDDEKKNSMALLVMELPLGERKKVIEELRVEDYIGGPIENKGSADAPVVWVFGKMIREYEVCIKISIGEKNDSPICISFHPAKEPMVYPFKHQ